MHLHRAVFGQERVPDPSLHTYRVGLHTPSQCRAPPYNFAFRHRGYFADDSDGQCGAESAFKIDKSNQHACTAGVHFVIAIRAYQRRMTADLPACRPLADLQRASKRHYELYAVMAM